MHILLPGPTPVPQEVQQAMLTAMSDHRGSLFEVVRQRVQTNLAELFDAPSPNHIAIVPASGTGGLEAAVQNLFMPNQRVLAIETGLFGQRFSEVAEANGLNVTHVSVPWGEAFDLPSVMAHLKANHYQGILVTHNETSTGVVNPIEELARQIGQISQPPLIVVDSISGVPSIPLTLATAVDVIIAASQKGFMCPPGLAILALSDRAKEAVANSRPHRFYFDLRPYLSGHLPYTPAISLWYGLDRALMLLQAEGSEPRYLRHVLLRNLVRAWAEAGGWTPAVALPVASPTVTALRLPAGENPKHLRQRLESLGLQIAGGLGPWSSDVIRIGHVGAVNLGDLWAGLGLMSSLIPHPDDALRAAMQVMQNA